MHGECVLLHAPGMNAEDTRVHIQTAPCIRGDDEDPTHKGWTWMSWLVGPVHSKLLQGLMSPVSWELRVGYFHRCQPCGPTHPAPVCVSVWSQGRKRGLEKPNWDVG